MGLLSDFGQILSPQETAKCQKFLKQLSIQQFLGILKKYKHWQKTTKPSIIKWGEEIQGHFIHINEDKQLELCYQPLPQEYHGVDFPLVLEYGRWMFEITPAEPYSTESNFEEIIKSIRKKYSALQQKSRIAMTIPSIPFLGLRDDQKKQTFNNQITKSLYIDDKHITNHLRYQSMTKNISYRRGCKVEIKVPIYMDKNTSISELKQTEPYQGFIYLDAMVFGMGVSCLQCTFSTQNLNHARYIYDQFHIISPLMLAVTAGTPFHKGKISNWDARWKIIESACDDRTAEERNPDSLLYLPHSRYAAAQLYINNGPENKPEYNDIKETLNINPKTKSFILEQAKLYDTEIDDYLLDHLANILKRDHLIAHEKFKEMTPQSNILFELINGTNWNSVRLKIPIDDSIGWRVEFRTMEVQLTADQNAAFSLLIHFITRVLHLDKKINLYIPMSLVMKNFDRAHLIDAARTQKFYWRTNIFDDGEPQVKQLSIHEIFFGAGDYVGLLSYVRSKMLQKCSKCSKMNFKYANLVEEVCDFVSEITSGKRLTLAQWQRNFVDNHPDYKHNSILPKNVIDDMLLRLNEISKGSYKDCNFHRIFSK